MHSRSASQVVIPAITLVIFLVLWKGICVVFDLSHILLPPPEAVIAAAWNNFGLLFANTSITMAQAIGGFFLGSATAYALAALFVFSPRLRRALYPFAIALKSTPLIALAPILVIWFGNGMLSKVVMSALLVFFPVLVYVYDGLRNIDPSLETLMKSLSADRWQVFWKVRVPHSLPSLFSALRVASPLAVVGSVIGEYTGATEGIGHVINTSSYYLETAKVFAGILFISIAGILFFSLVCWIDVRVLSWRQDHE